MKKVCILSIDGGGIRGILSGTILSYIENELRKKEGYDVRLSDYFDLFAGTSTGGILTCAYIVPDENKRPKFTADEAVNFYVENGKKIFSRNAEWGAKSLFGILKGKYSSKDLEKVLEQYIGQTKMDELLTPCIITSYDITRRKSVFFNKLDAMNNKKRNFYVKDVARSTSAAPTYFSLAKIKSLAGDDYNLVDGGVFANNPSMCAYAEARTLDFQGKKNKPGAKDMILISVGNGSQKKPYSYHKAKNWGNVGWIIPVIDIMMSANSETVHYQLLQLFNTIPLAKRHYYRLEPKIYPANQSMDDASEENISNLIKAGDIFVDENKELLDNIVKLLIDNKL